MRNRMRALAVIALSLAAFQAQAQVTSPKLILQGTPSVEIPLEATSSVTVNANGDLQAQCRDGTCPTGSGGGGTIVVTLTPSATEITTASAFSLSWTSTGAEVCRGVSPTSIASWAGQLLPPNGTRNVTPPVGEHVFVIRCYGVGASADDSTPTVTVTQGGGQTGDAYCAEYYNNSTAARTLPTHASFTAYGLEKVEVPYQSVFDVLPGETQSQKKVLLGNFLRPATGKYLAIPFVMTSETDSNLSNLDMNWIEGGAYGGALIPSVPSGPIAFTVSPCPGDFRRVSSSSADLYERGFCRRTTPNATGTLRITSDPTQTGSCYAPMGKVMYLNVTNYNMSGTTLPSQSQCPSDPTCGVAVQVD
jgi:hypothetical protein